MRADRLALVSRDENTIGALLAEDVEVIEPEISHHFFELTIALDGTDELRRGELLDDPLWTLLGRGTHPLPPGATAISRPLREVAAPLEVGLGEPLVDFVLAHREDLERGDLRCNLGVVDVLRMKLLRNPAIDAHGDYSLDVSRTWPERKPVQRMERLLTLGERGRL